jgi:hypothetical protein
LVGGNVSDSHRGGKLTFHADRARMSGARWLHSRRQLLTDYIGSTGVRTCPSAQKLDLHRVFFASHRRWTKGATLGNTGCISSQCLSRIALRRQGTPRNLALWVSS